MTFLKNLPFPKVIENLDYETILDNTKILFKEHLNSDEIVLLESDNYSALLETLSYRELLLRARINDSLKELLLPYATGSNLDNIVALYGIQRLEGSYPIAQVEFSLSIEKETDTIIPAGLVLQDDKINIAKLKEDVIINAGEKSVVGIVELEQFIQESSIKCEYIQTPLPFVLKAKQLSSFQNGATIEDDERLRERAVLSLERFSTAGSRKSYIFHTLSSTVKVQEVEVENGGAGVVNIYIKTPLLDIETKDEVQEYLSGDTVRPLTDTVQVFNATKKDIEVVATLELIDMFRQDEVNTNILNSKHELSLGEDLNLSYIYSILHQDGVYRAILKEPLSDIKVAPNEFVEISFNLSFAKANL